MKRIERRFLAAVLAVVLLAGLALPATAEEVRETETQETTETLRYTQTIYIRSARELLKFAENCKLDTWSIGKRVILKKDIDLEGIDFAPIPTFAGRFDGRGHTISGLTLEDSLTPAGLFGELQATGIVCDLTVSGRITPAGDAQYVGGIVGENHGIIANCTFTGSVSGSGNVGGIVGLNGLTGKIQNCQAEGTIQGSSMAGGITGCNLGLVESSANRASVNTVSIDPTVDASDINFDFLTDISKLTSLDTRSAAMDTGGIAGYSSGILTDCRNEATIGYPHTGYNVGGIAGRSCGYVSGCANSGEVYGRKDVGGILGQMEPFIAKNLSESSLAQLQRQLEELDTLVGTTLEDADGLSDTLTARLGAIASSVGSAADAAGNIQTSGTISGDVTGSGESGGEGSITITPAEGGIGGGIQIGDGSISGGIGGSLSGGVAGDGNGSASGSLNAQAQIEIDTNLEGLSSALSNMAGQMRILSGELGGASGELKADVEKIRAKINEITQLGFDLVLGDNEDVLIDSSDIDMDLITLGKAADCKSAGLVSGDINTGGIAGCMAMGFDALKDLGSALQISDKDIAYGGKLAIAFGARGSGNAVAHYEPLRQVINLTKMHGAGSLAHEWWHGFDDYLGAKMGAEGFLSEHPGRYPLFQKLIDTMKYKQASPEQSAERVASQPDRTRKNAESWLDYAVLGSLKRTGNEAYLERYAAMKELFLSGEHGMAPTL